MGTRKIHSQKLSNLYKKLTPKYPSPPVLSARTCRKQISCPCLFPGPSTTYAVYVDKILLLKPLRAVPLVPLHWLNHHSPAGKQASTITGLQADYECHLQRWSPSEGNLCFISIKRSKEHWPRPGGPVWSLGIPVDL